MKLIVILPLLLTFEFALLVYADSTSDNFEALVALNEKEKNAAAEKLMAQSEEAKRNILNLLNEKVIPSVNEVYKDIENHINNLKDETVSSGFDVSICISSYRQTLAESNLPNITEKAIHEVKHLYEVIHLNNLLIWTYKVYVISKEIDSITTEYEKCAASDEPQYCNRSFNHKFSLKEAELPILYNKEVERAQLFFIQEVATYENRVQDYVHEAIIATKPYLAVLENCVEAVIATSGRLNVNSTL